jgi:hypothetical protein
MKNKNKIHLKFGKKSSDISKIKKNFLINNNSLLDSNLKIVEFLKKQSLRATCKNCGLTLPKKIDCTSHNMAYKICINCTHLNSKFNDSQEFHDKIYHNEKFSYAKNYMQDYKLRVKNIYVPKVNFITEFLKKKKTKNVKILDIGSGCGHFLKACHQKKISALGLESNLDMIKLGQKYLKKNSLVHSTSYENSLKIIKDGKYTMISLISVIEHLERPNEIFNSFKKSKNKYLFLSIPLFNFSAFLENAFQNVYPRHMAATHPHLYTYESIKYILKRYKLKICSEWWFGSDMIDLNRSLLVSFGKNKSSNFSKKFKESFSNQIDELQNVLDRKKLSSEVHLIISHN